MRWLTFIVLIFVAWQVQAQQIITDTTIKKYINGVQINISSKTALIPTKINTNNTIVYLNMVNAFFDDGFTAFKNSNPSYNYVNIEVSFNDDTILNKNQLLQFNSIFNDSILPIVLLLHKNTVAQQIMLIGVNNMAAIVLLQAATHPNLFYKNALLVNEVLVDSVITATNETIIKQLKGKLFLYHNTTKAKVSSLYNLIDFIALKANIFIYKITAVDNGYLPIQIFRECSNWFNANGNNYIIKPIIK